MPKVKTKKAKRKTFDVQAGGKNTNFSMMDQLSIGMVVDICRSDGRTHSAVVSKIRADQNLVDVEWFESNETKGKAIDIATILRNNPNIAPLSGSNNRVKQAHATPKAEIIQVPKAAAPNNDDSDVTTYKTSRQAATPKNNAATPKQELAKPTAKTKASDIQNGNNKPTNVMDQLSVGMAVDICRSDGRTHSAVVAKIRADQNLVDVEWFESNETKGKSVDIATILKNNPNIAPLTSLNNKVNQARAAPEPEIIEVPKPAPPKERPTPLKSRQTIAVPKTAEPLIKQEMLKPPRKTLANVTKHQVVLKNEEIERNRIERRAQQAEERRMRDDLRGLDPGNPNWEFFKMIRDFRASLDYRPLRPNDSVIDDRICVCVRKRPLGKKEKDKKEIDIVTIPTKEHIYLHQPKFHVDLTKYLDNQKFRFDYVFDDFVENEMVYHFTAQPLVETVFQGGFATCFAYGQTGSGKTYTMGGQFEGKVQDCSKGIYALCANDVFDYLDRPEYCDLDLYVVCSFFELYGSKPFDLLAKRAERKILEDKKKNVQIVGLKETEVSCAAEVLKLIREGSLLRTAGQTSANDNSSRSHAVFQIILKRNDNSAIHGKFSLIDLAGSERGADTKASEATVRREGGEINKSLLALKECIRSMGMNKQHVPFRQSKLTLVLRDSFIGKNARTCMIATISPGLLSSENTLNTLRYANRAKELDSDVVDAEEPESDGVDEPDSGAETD